MSNRSFIRVTASVAAATLALAGCGSDDDTPSAGSNTTTQAQVVMPTFDNVQLVPMSSTEHDRLLGAAFDAENRLYGAGWVASGADHMMAVSRFGADGVLDASFGTAGVATVNVAAGGKDAEVARGVVVQEDGKVVISGAFEHDPAAAGDAARDTDIALARFDRTGKLDASFGTGGVVKIDLGAGAVDGTNFRGDVAWGLTKLSTGKLALVGGRVGPGENRTDLDFAVIRLNQDGSRDTTFGTDGVASVTAGPNVVESPKTAIELKDGRLVVTGYANIDGIVKVVLFRLTKQGVLDPTFGEGGVSVTQLLGHVAESYAVAAVGDRLVTTGYGRDVADGKVDLITAGFTSDGRLDPTFGTEGSVRIDVAGDDDRGRNIVGLPGGGALMVGSGKPTPEALDAMVVKLTADGALDTTFGDNGRRLFDVGGPNDAFFGVAVSPDKSRVAVVGYLGRAADGPDKDDSAVLWLAP